MIASIIIWFLGYYPQHDAYETVAEQQENSYIGQIGKAVEPVIEPLGFDWKLGIGLISGVGAKELVVSTLGVLYTNEEDVENVNLSNRIPITPLAALAYMLFVLIYFPCIATLAAIKQESGSWKWALFAAGYTTVLAVVHCFCCLSAGKFDYLVNSFLFLLFFKHGITTNHSFSHCFLVYDMGWSSYLFVFQEDKE